MKSGYVDGIGPQTRGINHAGKKPDAVTGVEARGGMGGGTDAGTDGGKHERPRAGVSMAQAFAPGDLAEKILLGAKEDFAGQDHRQRFRHVTSASSVVPARGLDRNAAFMVKAELEARGLIVALIRTDSATETYHLELSVAGGTVPRDAVNDPLLESVMPDAASPVTASAESLDETARHSRAFQVYGLRR